MYTMTPLGEKIVIWVTEQQQVPYIYSYNGYNIL